MLRGGKVFDGTGLPGVVADVAVRDGHIAAIGDLSRDTGRTEISARGLVVAPGFINIHGHPQADAAATARNMLFQGVTTEIGNADGLGSIDLTAQLRDMASHGLATNLGLYIGFNAAWSATVGPSDRRATDDEIRVMRNVMSTGLESGAWGISAGLDYKPAYFAPRDQVVAVVSAGSRWRTNFPNHERLTPESGYSGLTGIRETIEIADASGLAPVVTHMKAQGAEQGRAADILRLIDDEKRHRETAAGDIYPYIFGYNNLASLLLPAWALEGGLAGFLGRAADPAQRSRMVADTEAIIHLRFNGPKGVYVASLGQELTDYMREWGVSPGEAVVRLNEQYREKQPTTYLRFGAEKDLIRMLKHPDVAVSCDCGSLVEVKGHPRAFGTFPKVLGHYVRETRVLTMADAVRKMSGLPAAIVGMVDRGLLAPGMAADVTVFDPGAVNERGNADRPEYAVGIRHVLVNGALAVRDGAATGSTAGKVILRGADMPSRLSQADVARSVRGWATLQPEGAVGVPQLLDFRLRQARGGRAATGWIKLRDPERRVRASSERLGVLQIRGAWATITGWLRSDDGVSRPFTLTIDAAPPMVSSPRATMVIGESPKRLTARSIRAVFERDGKKEGPFPLTP